LNIELIEVNGIPMTDSKNVSDKFKKEHRTIYRKVSQLMVSQPVFGAANFGVSSYTSEQNKTLPSYTMTRDGFSMIAMSLTGPEAEEWKIKYIKAFNAMEKIISRDHDTIEWKQARLQSKQSRKSFTDVVKRFVDYATNQGSKSASMYYMNITKMEYAALELTEKGQKAPVNLRDTLDCMDLCFLATAEQVAKNALNQGMNERMNYKEIYRLAKEKVFNYAETVSVPRLN
jgi:Rha family phage regulatory protein